MAQDHDDAAYKGILLSNRPESVAIHKTNQKDILPYSQDMKIPFIPSGSWQHTPLGLPPPRDVFYNINAKSEKSSLTANHKYKEYLKELETNHKLLKINQMEEELKLEEKQSKFKETQAILRKLLRESNSNKKEIEELLDTNGKSLKDLYDSNNRRKKKEAPKWALTEKKLEEEGEKEVDELIEFANNLDFEEYVQDDEIRDALQIIQTRVEELKEETAEDKKQIQEQGNTDASTKQNSEEKEMVHKKPFILRPTMEKTNSSTSIPAPPPMDSIVKQIIKNSPTISKVHSSQSVTHLVEQVKQQNEPIVSIVDQPRILLQLRKDKTNVQNLPYLYRCPSI